MMTGWTSPGLREAADLYARIRPEYEHDPDVFNPEPPRTRSMKAAIERLPEADKAIIRLYAELESLSKLGRMLGVSKDTAWKVVRRIRARVLELMAEKKR